MRIPEDNLDQLSMVKQSLRLFDTWEQCWYWVCDLKRAAKACVWIHQDCVLMIRRETAAKPIVKPVSSASVFILALFFR